MRTTISKVSLSPIIYYVNLFILKFFITLHNSDTIIS